MRTVMVLVVVLATVATGLAQTHAEKERAFHDEYFYAFDATPAWGPSTPGGTPGRYASVQNWIRLRVTHQTGKTYNLVGWVPKFEEQYVGCPANADPAKCKNDPLPAGAGLPPKSGTGPDGKVWYEYVVKSQYCPFKDIRPNVCEGTETYCQNDGGCAAGVKCVAGTKDVRVYALSYISAEHWIDATHNQTSFPGGCTWPRYAYGAPPASVPMSLLRDYDKSRRAARERVMCVG